MSEDELERLRRFLSLDREREASVLEADDSESEADESDSELEESDPDDEESESEFDDLDRIGFVGVASNNFSIPPSLLPRPCFIAVAKLLGPSSFFVFQNFVSRSRPGQDISINRCSHCRQ